MVLGISRDEILEQNNSRRCRSRTHPLHDAEITKDGQGAIRSKILRSSIMRTTWKPFNNKTKLTFLLSLTFLFLFAGISEAGVRLLIAKKITKTILKILDDDIKERPLLHLVEGGKFAAKKIKARGDKGREERADKEREEKEEDVSRDYLSGDPLYRTSSHLPGYCDTIGLVNRAETCLE